MSLAATEKFLQSKLVGIGRALSGSGFDRASPANKADGLVTFGAVIDGLVCMVSYPEPGFDIVGRWTVGEPVEATITVIDPKKKEIRKRVFLFTEQNARRTANTFGNQVIDLLDMGDPDGSDWNKQVKPGWGSFHIKIKRHA